MSDPIPAVTTAFNSVVALRDAAPTLPPKTIDVPLPKLRVEDGLVVAKPERTVRVAVTTEPIWKGHRRSVDVDGSTFERACSGDKELLANLTPDRLTTAAVMFAQKTKAEGHVLGMVTEALQMLLCLQRGAQLDILRKGVYTV